MAIAWVMAQGEDVLPIPEMKTRAHLADNLGAMDIQYRAKNATSLLDR